MTEREQQELNNKLIRAILNGKDDQAVQLLKLGASPYAHECMSVKEAVNHDRVNMLKILLSDDKLMQHVQANPDIVCGSFIDEPQNSMQALSYIVNETKIDIEGYFKNKEGVVFVTARELVKKFRLNYNMSQKPHRPKIKNKSHSMKI